MIVRTWRARATAANVPRYRAHLLGHVAPVLQGIAGFQGLRLLRRPVGELVEIVVQTEWASMDAIRHFTGPDPSAAVVEPEAAAVLVEFDGHVEHLEIVDELGPA